MRTVVVTGAAGSLGRRVVSLLAEPADETRVIALDSATLDHLPAGVDARQVDLADGGGLADDELDATFAGADGVIHLAWRLAAESGHSRGGADPASAANHRAVERVLAAAGRAEVAGVVILSSATVYGAWPDNPVPLTEEAPLRPNPELAFAVGKADAERVVADWSDLHPDVAVAVLRPVAVVGAPTQPLHRALGGTGGPRGDDATRRVQFVHADDLAAAVAQAWRDELRGPFNVAPDAGTLEHTARALTGGVARVRLPSPVATVVASWGWGVSRRGVPKAARAYATYPWVVAPDRLKAAGWVPRYTSEEALVATDGKSHWDDLPPGKRQNYTLLVVVIAAVTTVLGAVGVASFLLRRRNGRGGTFRG